ncbi:MAG: hypothetical protein WC365_07220 [Candidatus Babeliales bacterium]|jgi:aspartate aminotransferase-like enzyme
MFGPNGKASFDGEYFHHREQRFRDVLLAIEQTFVDVFGLHDYDVLVLTGSGTFSNEVVLSSFRGDMRVLHYDMEFGRRLAYTRSVYERQPYVDLTVKGFAYPLYETSISRLNAGPSSTFNEMTFADCVSAFPYYRVPDSVDVFTTVSSKQLGAYPVLGIVGIRKNLRLGRFFSHRSGSILDAYRHLSFREKGETANTPAIPLYVSLLRELETFDRNAFIEKIDARREMLLDVLPHEWVIGEGPVLTLEKRPELNTVVTEFNLYKGVAGYQVFLWSGDDCDYERLRIFLKAKLR